MADTDDLKKQIDDLKIKTQENTTKINTYSNEIKRLRTHRDTTFSRLEKLERNDEIVNFQLKQIIESLYELKADLKTLKEKPSKTLDFVITGIVSVVVSSIGMFIINKILNS